MQPTWRRFGRGSMRCTHLRQIMAASFYGLVIAAVVGYCAALTRWRRPAGRVFRSVHFWFTYVGGVVLATIGGINWPPPRAWPEGVRYGACFVAGLVLLTLGVVHLVTSQRGKSFEDF